jgi:hypothetical protein
MLTNELLDPVIASLQDLVLRPVRPYPQHVGTFYSGGWETLLPLQNDWRRRLYLREDERQVLYALLRSPPLNKYRLRKETTMHQTQVVRAVKRLRWRNAIQVVSKQKWRTGKISRTYGLTPMGSFLLVYDRRKSLTVSQLLDGIRSYADDVKSTAIWNLVASIGRIQNERTRLDHAMKLIELVFESQERISQNEWQMPIICEFIRRTWTTLRDIESYDGKLSKECRRVLSATKDNLMRGSSEIAWLMSQQKMTDYY